MRTHTHAQTHTHSCWLHNWILWCEDNHSLDRGERQALWGDRCSVVLRPCGSAALKMEPTSAEMKDDLKNELLHQAAKPSGGRTSKGLMFLNCNQWSCATPSHPRVQTGVHTGTNTHAQTERQREWHTFVWDVLCGGQWYSPYWLPFPSKPKTERLLNNCGVQPTDRLQSNID